MSENVQIHIFYVQTLFHYSNDILERLLKANLPYTNTLQEVTLHLTKCSKYFQYRTKVCSIYYNIDGAAPIWNYCYPASSEWYNFKNLKNIYIYIHILMNKIHFTTCKLKKKYNGMILKVVFKV